MPLYSPSIHIQMILDVAETLGVPQASILNQAEVSSDLLSHPFSYVSRTQYQALFQDALARTRRADLPLLMGSAAAGKKYGLIGHLLLGIPTLRASAEIALNLNRAALGYLDFQWETTLGLAQWRIRSQVPGLSQTEWEIEFLLCMVKTAFQEISGGTVNPIVVHFTHAPHADPEEYRRHFGVLPEFGAEENFIGFPDLLMDSPTAFANAPLAATLKTHVDQDVQQKTPDPLLCSRLREWLLSGIEKGEANLRLKAAASRSVLTERTLQNRLREEGTRFSILVEDIRQQAALAGLRDPANRIGQIALSLGFSEERSFFRAFRRWTGTTPQAYRERMRVLNRVSPSVLTPNPAWPGHP